MTARALDGSALADVHAALRARALEAASHLSMALCAQEAVELQGIIEAAQSRLLVVVGHMHAHGATEALSQQTTYAWARDNLRLSGNAASRMVKLGEALHRDLPAVAAGLTAGRLTTEQAQSAAMAVRDVSPEQMAKADAALAEQAVQASVGDFARTARRLAIVLSTEGGDRHFDRQREARRLSISQTLDGSWIGDFSLDAEAGATVLAALDPLCRPLGGEDHRSAAQRRADALAELCQHALDTAALPERGGVRPHVQVLIHAADLVDLTGAAAVDGSKPGHGGDRIAAMVGTQIAGAGPVPPSVWMRLSCDAAVRRIVLDPDGCPLDVGTAVRTATGAQRAALLARDGGCAYPGCHRPSGWVDVHHIRHWRDGGPTDLANLISLCRHHHSDVHRHRYRIEAHDGIAVFIARGGRRLGQHRVSSRRAEAARSRPTGTSGATNPS